jgi:plastin-1
LCYLFAGDSREERVFRMWINSLNLPDVYVNNLFEDLQDGYIILLLEDTVQPGVVTWKRVR